MKFVCPSCEKPIYNRRLSHCEFCSALLPEELVYSDEQKALLEEQYRESRAKEEKRTTTGSQGMGSIGGDISDGGGCE